MGESALPAEEQDRLRSQGLIMSEEVAVQQGDLLVAVHVITQERRIISKAVTESRESKRLLKG